MTTKTLISMLLGTCLLMWGCDTKTKNVDSCGDDFLDPGEECDGTAFSITSCEQLGFYVQTGSLTCGDDCRVDLSVCVSRCGDGIIQAIHGEQCDGSNLANQDCDSVGRGTGVLACNTSCRYDYSQCENTATCGDGLIKEPFEQCEGEDLAGKTCLSLGFYGGVLSCRADDCAFDLESCMSFGRCGDGIIQDAYDEQCEGANVGGRTCTSEGFHAGTLMCGLDCQLDLSGCEVGGRCGDGLLQSEYGETCDGTELDGQTCLDHGFYQGTLACGEDCNFDLDACSEFCGDGVIQSLHENCDGALLDGQSCRLQSFFTGPLACSSSCDFDPSGCLDTVSLSSGFIHACVALTDGTARCWGNGSSGRLGDGDVVVRVTPVVVNAVNNITSVTAGTEHSCALLTDGTAKCWGRNDSGHLGDGSIVSPRLTAVPVVGLAQATALAAGWRHTCALRSSGDIVCWGSNESGQLGNSINGGFAVTPEPVTGISDAVAITAGYYHTCALLSTGQVRCWGANGDGQVGDNTTTNRISPVEVSNLSSVVSVDAGGQHTCAARSDGTGRCWGANAHGQLGDGTTTRRLTPVSVQGITDAVSLDCGQATTCALLSNGTVLCWGANEWGQLGDGTYNERSTPAVVAGATGVAGVSLGASYVCTRMTDGKVIKCWGVNQYGSLGDGSTMTRLAPTPVAP